MLALLDGMLARGVPIHGIGIEAHLRGDQAAVLGDASYEAFLGELARRGMKIFITELDVQDVALPADAAARDQAVADIYSRFLSASLRQPAVKGIVTWGLADCFTWIAGYRPRQGWFAGAAAPVRRQLPTEGRVLCDRPNASVSTCARKPTKLRSLNHGDCLCRDTHSWTT